MKSTYTVFGSSTSQQAAHRVAAQHGMQARCSVSQLQHTMTLTRHDIEGAA